MAGNSGLAAAASDPVRWDPTTPPVVVDVIFLLSPSAIASAGNEESLRQNILKEVDHANFLFTNSLAGVRLNPVFIGRFNYTDSGNIARDLDLISTDARAATLRNDYKADLVFLIVEAENFGFGGIAQGGMNSGNPAHAYSVLRRTLFAHPKLVGHAENHWLAHEAGHLFGAQHDREHAMDSNFQVYPGRFPYSYGHRFQARGITYITIMSYDPGIPIPYFSSPGLLFDGVPAGVPSDEPLAADNVQTINRMAPIVAGYRSARGTVGFAERAYRIGEGDGSVTVRLVREGDLNNSTRVVVGVDPASTARQGLDYHRPSSLIVNFATNQAVAEISFEILQDDLIEGEETILLTLANVTGGQRLSPIASTTIFIIDDEDAFVVSPAAASIPEQDGEAEFTFEFAGSFAERAVYEVDVLTHGTATAGVDFEFTPARLAFTEENRRQTVQVRALDDELPEPDETVQIQVGNAIAELRILDDDRAGALLGWTAVPNNYVTLIRALANGGAMVAGDFTDIDGSRRTGLARLHSYGSLDFSFNPPELLASPVVMRGVPPARVSSLAMDSRGRWMVGGMFTWVDGVRRSSLIRLLGDGSLDESFSTEAEFDGHVWGMALQPDGKILVTGTFEHAFGKNIRALIRLNEDGSWDPSFRLESGFGGILAMGQSIALLPDGKIMVGGYLESYQGQPARNIVRINADGTWDETFALRGGASGAVTVVQPLPDGRCYVAGYFEVIGGRPNRRLARLNPDGSPDLTFRLAAPPNGEAHGITLLPNDQLLVTGAFTMIGGLPRRFLALLNSDGSVDPDFDLGGGAGDYVWAAAAGANGTLYLGGTFRTINEQPAVNLARMRFPSIAGRWAGFAPGTNGAWRATIFGLPGSRHQIEQSSDLINWSPGAEVLLNGETGRLEIQFPSSGERGFFRLNHLGSELFHRPIGGRPIP
jgi:uncharacterized delta-60 repeat protein